MLKDAFSGTRMWAFLQEGTLAKIQGGLITGPPFCSTIEAVSCRYMDLIIQDDDRKNRYRLIIQKSIEEAIIAQLEEIGLVEVPKGAEDPEELKRVWVRK